MVEPFAVLLALVPLIGYLGVLSLIRLSGSTLVTTGGRDIAALGIAIFGLVAVGPIELFFPRPAATLFGAKVWIALVIFYALCVSLIAMTSRAKLVIYGRTPDEVFQPLLAACQRIDPSATGNSETLQIAFPASGLRVRIAGQKMVDCAEVIAFEPNLTPTFWSRLLSETRTELGETKLSRPRYGFAMLLAAFILCGLLLWQSYGNQELVVQGFRDWLWR